MLKILPISIAIISVPAFAQTHAIPIACRDKIPQECIEILSSEVESQDSRINSMIEENVKTEEMLNKQIGDLQVGLATMLKKNTELQQKINAQNP